MEAEKKEKTVMTVFKQVVKFGVSTVLGNLMMVGMPGKIHWLLKAAIGLGTGVLTMMTCEKVDGFIDDQAETVRKELAGISESVKGSPQPTE